MLLGTAVLVKNGIGIAGAAVCIGICAVPLIQVGFLMFLYKLIAALIEPVSDRRIVSCIAGMGNGYELLARAVFTSGVLFLLTIGIAAAVTT